MKNQTVYLRHNGKQGSIVMVLRQGSHDLMYKVRMPGYSDCWVTVATFKREFSFKPLTESRYRTPKFLVTA